MSHITLNGASIEAGFIRGFKKFEAFTKEMEGKIPDWVGGEREILLKKVWNIANEIEEKVDEEIKEIQKPKNEIQETIITPKQPEVPDIPPEEIKPTIVEEIPEPNTESGT